MVKGWQTEWGFELTPSSYFDKLPFRNCGWDLSPFTSGIRLAPSADSEDRSGSTSTLWPGSCLEGLQEEMKVCGWFLYTCRCFLLGGCFLFLWYSWLGERGVSHCCDLNQSREEIPMEGDLDDDKYLESSKNIANNKLVCPSLCVLQ